VADADIDDVIAIAARRQDDAREAAQGASRAEVAAVAAELDIGAEHVEAAIDELRARRAAEAKARAKAEAESAARRVWIGRAVALVGVAAIGVGGLGIGGTVGLAWLGAGGIRAAEAEAHAAESRLDAVLERQASLAPQLVGIAGGEGAELKELAKAVRSAPTVEGRLDAADELSAAMAERLGQLPPPATDAEATLRLQLHDEVTGSQNRISVELRRYREAVSSWESAASGPLGGLAVTLGFAYAPPG
jgi:hypothetical protein